MNITRAALKQVKQKHILNNIILFKLIQEKFFSLFWLKYVVKETW